MILNMPPNAGRAKCRKGYMAIKTPSKTKEKTEVRREMSSHSSHARKPQKESTTVKLPKLNVGSSFSLFLADYKAANSK